MPPVSPAVRPAGRLPARKGGPPQSPVCVFGKVTSTQGAASVDSQEFSARKGSRRALTVTRRASSRPPRPRIRGPFERERGVPAHRLAVAARGSLLPRSPSRHSCVGLTAGKYSVHRRRRTGPSAGGLEVLREGASGPPLPTRRRRRSPRRGRRTDARGRDRPCAGARRRGAFARPRQRGRTPGAAAGNRGAHAHQPARLLRRRAMAARGRRSAGGARL